VSKRIFIGVVIPLIVALLVSFGLAFSQSNIRFPERNVTLQVPDDFATIQAAIDAAEPGAQINVRGRKEPYPEHLVITKKNLLLKGIPSRIEGAIPGRDMVSPKILSLSQFGDWSVVQGFEIIGGRSEWVQLVCANCSFRDNVVRDSNVVMAGSSILVLDSQFISESKEKQNDPLFVAKGDNLMLRFSIISDYNIENLNIE